MANTRLATSVDLKCFQEKHAPAKAGVEAGFPSGTEGPRKRNTEGNNLGSDFDSIKIVKTLA